MTADRYIGRFIWPGEVVRSFFEDDGMVTSNGDRLTLPIQEQDAEEIIRRGIDGKRISPQVDHDGNPIGMLVKNNQNNSEGEENSPPYNREEHKKLIKLGKFNSGKWKNMRVRDGVVVYLPEDMALKVWSWHDEAFPSENSESSDKSK